MKAIRSDEETPSPPKKPSYWDVLMSLGPSGLRDAVKATIVRNTHPFGYGGVDNEPIKRVIDILREPESESPAHREALGESLVTQAQKERESLLSMLMGFGGNLPSSDYREGAYRSPVTERSLKMLLENPETRDRGTLPPRLPCNQLTLALATPVSSEIVKLKLYTSPVVPAASLESRSIEGPELSARKLTFSVWLLLPNVSLAIM